MKNIKFDVTSEGIKILEEGNYEISIYVEENEFIIVLDKAHCHSETIDETIKILDYALAGKLKIIYKLRGDKVVADKIQIMENGTSKFLSWSSSLFSPFWKRKAVEEKFFRNPD